jgi:phosphoribosylglycinamide formyltransferase
MIVQDEPDLVVLAGWMHILSQRFLDILHGTRTSPDVSSPAAHHPIPVINLHPALPGAFDGVNAIQRAWEAFQQGNISKAGVMVHRVVAEVDRGEPIVVSELDMREGETLEEWEKRVHQEEWKVIVEGTRKALEKVEMWREEERRKREEAR